MMIDFALVAEGEQKISALEAIHQACLQRFRPIMMTTLWALIAGLSLAVETGAGSQLRRRSASPSSAGSSCRSG